jgi:hypothetical protein
MAVLDDVVGIVVFFSVNSYIASRVSGGAVPLYMIPVMIFLPIGIGILPGFVAGEILQKKDGRAAVLAALLCGITVTAGGLFFNLYVFTGIVCGVLEGTRPDLAAIVKGTIAAAAVINEIIAVFAAKRGFELAGEIGGKSRLAATA